MHSIYGGGVYGVSARLENSPAGWSAAAAAVAVEAVRFSALRVQQCAAAVPHLSSSSSWFSLSVRRVLRSTSVRCATVAPHDSAAVSPE